MHTNWFWARKTVIDWPHHHTWSGYAPGYKRLLTNRLHSKAAELELANS